MNPSYLLVLLGVVMVSYSGPLVKLGLSFGANPASIAMMRMALSEAVEMAESGTMSSGMIPKINACVTALSAGVKKAHIINGTLPHSLVLEIFTDTGVGTLVVRHHDDYMDPDFVEAPVSNFASKLEQSIQTIGRGE